MKLWAAWWRMQVCPAVWLAQSLSHHGLSRPGPGSNTVVQHRHREPPAMKGPPNCTVITMRWCRSPHCLSRGQVPSVPSLCATPGPPWQSRVAQMDMAPVGSALWAHSRNNHSAFGTLSSSRTGQPPQVPASQPSWITHFHSLTPQEIRGNSLLF